LETAKLMVDNLYKCSSNLGITVDHPIQYFSANMRNVDDWIEHLEKTDLIKGVSQGQLKLIIVILDRNSKHIYKDIKNYVYTKVGAPIQVMLKENASKNLSYYSNVLNQIVVKMGGQLHNIPMPNEFSVSIY
jgi:hypothetical protein